MEYNYGAMNVAQFVIVIIITSLFLSYVGKKYNYSVKTMIKSRNISGIICVITYIATILLLLFLSSFREIGGRWTKIGGYDAPVYKSYFHNSLIDNHFEPGFALLVKIIRIFTDNYSVFLIIISIIMICSMIYYLKWSNCSNLILTSMMVCLYFASFNVLRTTLAIFIFLDIIILISKQKYLKSIILAIAAISIHISALIILPVIFINYLFKNKNKIKIIPFVLLIATMILLSSIAIVIVSNRLRNTAYETYVDDGQTVIKIYLFATIVYALFLKYRKKTQTESLEKTLLASLPIIYLVFPMQQTMVITYRMVEYFLPIMYLMMSKIIKNNKNMIVTIVIIALYLYKIISFIEGSYYLGIN